MLSFSCPRFFFGHTDASSSNEAVHLQQRLKSLSTELVTLRNRLHVGPASPTGGCGTINGPSNQTTAGSAGGCGTISASLATSTPAASGLHANGLQHPQQFSTAAVVLSTSPPAPSAFSANIPIGNAHKHQKPTYSNQTVTGAGSAIVPIVSPRNTSIPHPLPPHVSTKATGN